MSGRSFGGDRRQKSKIDKMLEKSCQGAQAKELVENAVKVLAEVGNKLASFPGSNTSGMRNVRGSVKLLKSAFTQVIPVTASASEGVAPIPSIGYATARMAVARKRDERMMADIADAAKRARTSHELPTESNPSEEAEETLCKFVNVNAPVRKGLTRPVVPVKVRQP